MRDFLLMNCHARRSCRSPTAYITAPGGLRTASFGRTWGLFMLRGPADEADTSHATYITYARGFYLTCLREPDFARGLRRFGKEDR